MMLNFKMELHSAAMGLISTKTRIHCRLSVQCTLRPFSDVINNTADRRFDVTLTLL